VILAYWGIQYDFKNISDYQAFMANGLSNFTGVSWSQSEVVIKKFKQFQGVELT
jgi:hypothetical protein